MKRDGLSRVRVKKLAPDEDTEQIVVATWLRHNKILFIHVPNQRNASVQEMVKLKAMGVLKGTSDLLVLARVPKHPEVRGVAIEMKAMGGRVKPDQREFIERVTEEGWLARPCFGADEAIEFLKSLGFGGRPVFRVDPISER